MDIEQALRIADGWLEVEGKPPLVGQAIILFADEVRRLRAMQQDNQPIRSIEVALTGPQNRQIQEYKCHYHLLPGEVWARIGDGTMVVAFVPRTKSERMEAILEEP